MTTHAPVLELFKLTKAYPSAKGPAVIVKDFTLNFAAGEFITLIGHSGCGKSTVLSMVAGLTDITDGAHDPRRHAKPTRPAPTAASSSSRPACCRG